MSTFNFREFSIRQEKAAMKVGTDSMVLGALLPQQQEGYALDIGTGTGMLALMLAQRNPGLLIDAVEIDADAAQEAHDNVQQSKFRDQITVHHADICQFTTTRHYQLMVSNPPYFSASTKSGVAARDLARHTDSLPLPRLLDQIGSLMHYEGSAYLILPVEGWEELVGKLHLNGLYPVNEINIWTGADNRTRVVNELRFEAVEDRSVKDLVIRDRFGNYTRAYIDLTRDFHDRDLSGGN